MQVQGRTIVITGAGRGIGRALAERFGRHIALLDLSAAQAGVAALAVVWAKELARYGIRSAAIAPGGTRTDILSAMRPEMLAKLIAPVPLRRLGEPHEIAAAAAFIVGNDFFTGRCIDLDGGSRL